jgi:hypothetical protein
MLLVWSRKTVLMLEVVRRCEHKYLCTGVNWLIKFALGVIR